MQRFCITDSPTTTTAKVGVRLKMRYVPVYLRCSGGSTFVYGISGTVVSQDSHCLLQTVSISCAQSWQTVYPSLKPLAQETYRHIGDSMSQVVGSRDEDVVFRLDFLTRIVQRSVCDTSIKRSAETQYKINCERSIRTESHIRIFIGSLF